MNTPNVRASAAVFVLALLLATVSFLSQARGQSSAQESSLEPLRYNNPGLKVDLGVGLWAWPIPCDADGDGDFDLIVSCPDKPSNGVWLFENPGGDTAENKFPVFKPGKRLSSTVHYVMPSYTKDGMRVLSPGFEYKDFPTLGVRNKVGLPIQANFYKPKWETNKGPRVRHNQWRYGDYDQDGRLDLIVGIEDWSEYGWDDAWDSSGSWTNGPLHGFVYVFRNEGTTAEPKYAESFELQAGGARLDVFGCPSPNFEDFDGDGDFDLLCGEFLDGFTYFRNIGNAQRPVYESGQVLKTNDGQRLVMDLQMIVPIAFDWDRDGDIDLIVGDEDGRVALIENRGLLDQRGCPQFAAPVYFQQEADELKCGALATPFAVDWDGDGDQDLLSGNTAGYIEFFENLSGAGVADPKWNRPIRLSAGDGVYRILAGKNGSIQGPAEAKWGYTTLSVADWNGDSLPDILVNSIWGRIEWLENIGTRTKPKLDSPKPIEVAWGESAQLKKPSWTWWEPNGNELVTQWRTTPNAVDWNADGLIDLVMLDQEGYLTYFERAKQDDSLVLLPPKRIFHAIKSEGNLADFVPLRLNDATAGRSGRRKICVVDWDGDGKLDLLVNSTNANLLQQAGSENGQYYFVDRGPLVERNIQGHTTSPTVVDFDGNGIPDFLGGAEDGRFYLSVNPRLIDQ